MPRQKNILPCEMCHLCPLNYVEALHINDVEALNKINDYEWLKEYYEL